MENDEKMLANEYIRGFLKRELNKPLKVLESRFNEYETQNKEHIKKLKKELSDSHDKYLLIEQNLDIYKMDNFRINKELVSIKEVLSNSIDKEEFHSFIKEVSNRLIDINVDSKNNIIDIEELKSDNSRYLINMTENIKLNDVNIVDLCNRFDEFEIDIEILKNYTLDSISVERDKRAEFYEQVDVIMEDIHSKISSYEAGIFSSNKSIEKTILKMSVNYLTYSSELDEKFDKLIYESSSDLNIAKRRIKEVQERVDNLKEEIIICRKGGKIDKEVDDFMKQVGYNAKQIERIQKKLEDM